MKKILAVILAAVVAPPAGAQVIKLGTLAPQGSTWHEILKDMGQRWEEASGGTVKLRVYAGGVQGDEGEMVRKMGIGQLQAASITNIGMHDILPDPAVMSVPLLFDGQAEADCAFEKVRPRLERGFAEKGYTVLQWSRVGAVHLFCNAAKRIPADMKDAKMYVWEGDPKSVQAFRAAGFTPVVLSATDIIPSLQTGMIDCVTTAPLYVLTARLFEKASYMQDLPWGFIYGATLVRSDAWGRIPADVRARLAAIAVELGKKVDVEVQRLNADAVAAMQRQGLQVVKAEAAAWRPALERSYAVVRGGVVPAGFFDEVKRARDACRAAKR
ncbi:MAG TPA: TRAP transporter substrate-binding protein DctP [Anaeromyxobacteraceae bacterium]|nr:TRAP transporter substrate-binding protein DctP [Anaeromyxobacteraceae bacterium]